MEERIKISHYKIKRVQPKSMLASLHGLFYVECDPQNTFWEALFLLSPVLRWLCWAGLEQGLQMALMCLALVH